LVEIIMGSHEEGHSVEQKSVKTLPTFTPEEFARAKVLLAGRVAAMLGRKFEEGDWAEVYCGAKGLPKAGWSNLDIDVMHGRLGVEHKMLCKRSKPHIRDYCGTRQMHPAATRSIRIPSAETDATRAAQDVLKQYGNLILARRKKLAENAPGEEPDLRTGWLLWQERLVEFLYFEEALTPPDPSAYYAEWSERGAGGARKGSRNLWVYERATDVKRYSITTEAGAKIQPYFDVPAPTDPNVYVFIVQGEAVGSDLVRIWITHATAASLELLLGTLNSGAVSDAILAASSVASTSEVREGAGQGEARELVISATAYGVMTSAFQGVSDEHRMQLVVQCLGKTRTGR
jgi:hypothetical protein